jgi:hypothetical protein
MSNLDSTVAPETRDGFSLLELLSAMAILMIIVMLMGVIFAEGDRIWTIGTNRVDNNSYGRAALNMIAHDLQYAVADDVLTFAVNGSIGWGGVQSYGFQNCEIRAVSLQNDSSDNNRTAREIYYYVQEMTNSVGAKLGRYYLVRGYWSAEILDPATAGQHCYKNKTWCCDVPYPTNRTIIADNVSAFLVSYPGGPSSYYLSTEHGNRLPEYVDVCLEILNERPARQAGELWLKWISSGNTTFRDRALDIVDKNQRRYTERVYFHNRYGYKVR